MRPTLLFEAVFAVLPALFFGSNANVLAQFCTQTESVKIERPAPDIGFATKLALSSPWVAVGASGKDLSIYFGGSGTVFVYFWGENDQLIYRQELWASNFSGGQALGHGLAMDADHIVAGAYSDSQPCGGDDCYAGSAYVFRRDDNGTAGFLMDDHWEEQAQLFAVDPQPYDYFGSTVDIDGDWIIVGAARNRCMGGSGSAFIYNRDDNGTPSDPTDDTWPLHAELTSPDVAQNPNDSFGSDVAIWGNRVVAGAAAGCGFNATNGPGAAYVFRRDDRGTPADAADDVWTLESRLLPITGDDGEMFGHSVDIERDMIVVGMPGDSTFRVLGGSVYVFRLEDDGTPGDPTDDVWSLETRLGSGNTPDELGSDVGISGDRVLAGAADHIHEVYTEGAGFVFRYAGGQWHKEQRLLGSDLVLWGAQLGQFVGMDENRIILSQDSFSNSWDLVESVYLYEVIDDCNGDCVSDADELAVGAPDCNGNGVPDDCDVDCNGNSIPDECDLGAGTSLDCNANGVPDECDPDCNNNDVPDDCDVAAGTSPDCNANGVPDECDTDDCNANGVPDSCDVASGTSPDCNGNAVPDECDVASGFSRDCTDDGIPDECTAICVDSCECHDDNPCTFDVCLDGTCVNVFRDYGDADNNGVITLGDLFCVLDGFAGDFTECTLANVDMQGPCGVGTDCCPNGVITLADLLAVLDAFQGIDPCCGG